ncbi:MAG: hypothetical protein M3361_06315 [Candidatus Tectomicrobia bacterium]|nr:hypothetical protein [Candidatus Tectomicrobia bacterium]
MRKQLSAFRATTLTYSSPAVDTTSPAPACFYNAFPDLNDEAPDRSRSAFPQRAKYNLPLDSEFLPSAMWVESNNITEGLLASLDSISRDATVEVIKKYGHINSLFQFPRTPELNKQRRLEGLFELGHKRLAATDCKWALRTYRLASFYTTLENHLERGHEIGVPLIKDNSPSASRLQRHWKVVFDAFQRTLLIDEAVSLLVCLALLTPEEAQAHEQAWLREEAAENRGFADYYQKLRDRFNPESYTAAKDRRALAEQIINYAKRALSSRTMENVSLADEVYDNLKDKSQRVFWPNLLGEEVHGGVQQLRVANNFALGNVAARISIPEAMQWIMATFSVWYEAGGEDEERSFTNKGEVWPEYVRFSLEIGDDIAYPRITSAEAQYLWLAVRLGIKKADGSEIDPRRTSADRSIANSICRYTILLESLRQQICTGVGLRCPFWTGRGCCEFRPLMQRTYDVCKPWYLPWKCHWQRPPCLG